MFDSQSWYEQPDAKQNAQPETKFTPAETEPNLHVRLLTLCKKGKAQGEQQEVLVLLSHSAQ